MAVEVAVHDYFGGEAKGLNRWQRRPCVITMTEKQKACRSMVPVSPFKVMSPVTLSLTHYVWTDVALLLDLLSKSIAKKALLSYRTCHHLPNC